MHPPAIPAFADQARLAEHAEVMRDKGRAEPERAADIAHAVLAMGEQLDDTRPVGLS